VRAHAARADRGFTLVEVLVSIVLLGLGGVAVLGAVAASARGSNVQRHHANAQSVAAAAADALMGLRPVPCTTAADDYQTAARASVDALALSGGWSGSTLTVTKVQEWNATAKAFDSGCVTTNPELVTPQLVSLRVAGTDGGTTKEFQVVTGAIPDHVRIGLPWVFGQAPFALVAFGDVHMEGQLHVWGGAAIGGDLSFSGNNAEIGKDSPGVFIAGTDSEPSSLLVEGKVDWTKSDGVLKVMSGWVHVNDMSNSKTEIVSSHLAIQPTAGGSTMIDFQDTGSDSQINQQHTVNQGGLYDFEAAQHVFTEVSLAMAALPGQCADATSARLVDNKGVPATSGNAFWEITPNRVNVLTTTIAGLGPMDSINNNGPSADHDTPLIINVMDAGAVVFDKGDISQNMDPYTIWNFPYATSIDVTGLVSGTLYAPNAAVTLQSEVRGALLADSVTGGYAVKWSLSQARPDIREIECERGV
jgi:choice-of-anchor A domain-containing protein/prepilin-type N-terminal cleavage/methylation domain-containing protein